jgi:hypothetical protein
MKNCHQAKVEDLIRYGGEICVPLEGKFDVERN